MSRLSLAVVGLLVVAAVEARAEEPTFEALGQAPVVGGDRVRAKERALDDGLRQAVEQAAAALLGPSELAARASELKLRIYPRARSYVTTWRVLEEGEQGGLFQLRLSAQVATTKLGRDLAALSPTTSPAAPKLRGVVCAQVTVAQPKDPLPLGSGSAEGVAALPPTGERGAVGGSPISRAAVERALGEILTARGVELIPAPATCGEREAAETVARAAGQGALVATVEVTPAGAIRGTDKVAAQAKAKVTLVSTHGNDSRAAAQGEAERAAWDTRTQTAVERAAREAAVEAAADVATSIAANWQKAQGAAAGAIPVRVAGLARFSDYQAVVRTLTSMPGVRSVEPRRFGAGEAELEVRAAVAATQLKSDLERIPTPGLRLSARPEGDGLVVEVKGETRAVEPTDGLPPPPPAPEG
jgi:hypothetical protein